MPRYFVHDNARRAYTDQEENDIATEVLQRLDRIEQAIMILVGGDNGNGEAEDQQPQPTTTTPRSEVPAGQRMGDELVSKGNLSKVGPDAYQSGMRWPQDKSGTSLTYTGDTSYQMFRDQFLSRNPINDRVVSINAANRRKYG